MMSPGSSGPASSLKSTHEGTGRAAPLGSVRPTALQDPHHVETPGPRTTEPSRETAGLSIRLSIHLGGSLHLIEWPGSRRAAGPRPHGRGPTVVRLGCQSVMRSNSSHGPTAVRLAINDDAPAFSAVTR